jgi:arylsulfatase I/J
MRGGKMSNWQGGIRVNAYAAGGLLPAAVAGTTTNNLMVGADVYATFCALAGVDAADARAAAAGLPPVDGVNQWPSLSGAGGPPPRAEVPVGSTAGEAALKGAGGRPEDTVVQAIVTAEGWKLMVGQTGQNIWTGPLYPNKTTDWKDVPYDCGVPGSPPPKGKAAAGCLFNVLTDPTEQNDVSSHHPSEVAALGARIAALQAGVYNPFRGGGDAGRPANERICEAGLTLHGGFVGPFLP